MRAATNLVSGSFILNKQLDSIEFILSKVVSHFFGLIVSKLLGYYDGVGKRNRCGIFLKAKCNKARSP